MNLEECLVEVKKLTRDRREVMNSGYENEGPGWMQQSLMTRYEHQKYGLSIPIYDDRSKEFFPLAEPATAQKQYARLMAAKAWLKENGK